ncbi:MAG: transposase [Casimicrobiaceae bacterium]
MRYVPLGRIGETRALAWRIAAATCHGAPKFADFASGAAVGAELALMQASGLWDIVAWVLLPSRFDALVTLRRGNVEDATAGFLARAAERVRHRRDSGGPIWDARFEWRPVRGDAEIAAVARELLRRPLRAHLVERLADYPFWDSCWVPAGRRATAGPNAAALSTAAVRVMKVPQPDSALPPTRRGASLTEIKGLSSPPRPGLR